MQSVIQNIEKELKGLYPKTEIQGFIRLIVEHVCNMNYTQFILKKNKKIGESEKTEIELIVRRLKKFEPLQYILGETEFYGLKLNVNPSVLIPRPETEEMVEWILNSRFKRNSKILDIGTGSGCIALALKHKIPEAKISAVDISKEVLKTAIKNAELNNLTIDFIHSDILNWKANKWEKFDVIVSNPPYVRELEKVKMQANVLDYEPENALFVPDNDPLIFYSKITEFAKVNLEENGYLFFEINENLAQEMTVLLMNLEFKNIEIKKDLNDKNRMLRCNK